VEARAKGKWVKWGMRNSGWVQSNHLNRSVSNWAWHFPIIPLVGGLEHLLFFHNNY
jgi:hypothetical protein